MKKGIIQLNQYSTKENTVESYVCFRKFIEFLEQKVQTDNTSRVQFYKIVLDKLRAFPELSENIPVEQTASYDEILELVAAIVLPLAEDEEEVMVGLTNASSPEVFYATNSFYRLFMEKYAGESPQSWIDEEALLKQHKQFQYNLVLKKVYGYGLPERNEIVHNFFNPLTGLYKYFRLNVDTRFVDIKVKPGMNMPDTKMISSCFECGDASTQIQKMLPLDCFTASGFCILSLTDVTDQQAVEQIGKAVVEMGAKKTEDGFIRINRLLQTIAGSNAYQFGLMPFFSINNRAALPYENFEYSILVKTSFAAGISKTVFTRYINHYLKKPDWIVYQPTGFSSNTLPVPVMKALDAADIHYYVLAPMYHNEKLVGIFEIAAGKDVPQLNDMQAARLKPAIPYLSQLLMMGIEKFNVAIDAIIKDKFTNIQPSVQWKFNEVAWHYFRSHDIEHKNTALEKIAFKEVYPLYGAVDIRNSTIERNKVLREDLEFELQSLISVLIDFYKAGVGEQYLVMATACKEWLEKMKDYVSVEEEQELNEFLYNEVHPHISFSDELPPRLNAKATAYFKSIDKNTGEAFAKRRQLENSMQMINKVVGQYFDLFKEELQTIYPSYFEKFRTDGVEYDMYIGQSIAPSIPFDLQYLETLRLWQIQSMAAIAKLTHSLLPQLEYPLETTQLLFVNARTIDISFRNDERRFDVEGAYNIRYHIVKKRIDKVHIYGTDERLTQPGKIAIVYFNEKDAATYIANIEKLQRENVLLNDLEHLELEELQGVAGLKALRVGVML